MFRIILGLVAGVVLAVCVIFLMELVGQAMFPFPPGLDPTRAADLKAALALAPPAALAFVVLGWVVGTAAGGWVANLVARRPWPAIAVGGAVAASSVANSLMIPQPMWVNIAGVAGPLAAAWLVSRAVGTPPKPV